MNEIKIIGFKFWKSKSNVDYVTIFGVYQRSDVKGFATIEATSRIEFITGGEIKNDAICKVYYGPRGAVGTFAQGIEIIR